MHAFSDHPTECKQVTLLSGEDDIRRKIQEIPVKMGGSTIVTKCAANPAFYYHSNKSNKTRCYVLYALKWVIGRKYL